LKPGRRYRVCLQLSDLAHGFPAGHRIRVAISSSYWPIAWPAPEPVMLTLFTGSSCIDLPVRAPRAEDDRLPPFPPPEASPPLAITYLTDGHTRETVERDLVSGETVFTTDESAGRYRLEHIGMDIEHGKREVFRIGDDDPTSGRLDIRHTRNLARGDWRVKTVTQTRMRATAGEFIVEASLDAFEGDNRVLSRNWQVRHKRDCT